jgi:exonuclease VII large subunit
MNFKEIKYMTLEEALREVLESKEDINSVIDALNYVSIPALNYIIEKNALEYYEAGDILPDDHPHTILTHHHGGMSRLLKKVRELEDENHTNYGMFIVKTAEVSKLTLEIKALKEENEKLKSDNHDLTTEILYANDREKSLKEKNEKLLHCYNSINNNYDVEKAKMVNDMNKLKALQEGQELILSWIKYMEKFRG